MTETLHAFAAAGTTSLISVGAGWSSPTAWTVAGLVIALLAVIARWASSRYRRVEPPAGRAVSPPRRPHPAAQRGVPQRTQSGKERP